MTKCPIGLICELMECDFLIYQRYAYAWDLPLERMIDHYKFSYWVVCLPSNEESYFDPDSEHEVEQNYLWQQEVKIKRSELRQAGYSEAQELPYCEHPDGGLLVYHDLEHFKRPVPISEAFQPWIPGNILWAEDFDLREWDM